MLHETWTLRPDPTAPSLARRALRKRLADLPANVLEEVLLLTTEVLTNSLRHSALDTDDQIHLVAHVSGTKVRIAVTDPGQGEVFAPQLPDPHALGGRGLLLVAELSDRWGVERSQATTVWFELALAARVDTRAG